MGIKRDAAKGALLAGYRDRDGERRKSRLRLRTKKRHRRTHEGAIAIHFVDIDVCNALAMSRWARSVGSVLPAKAFSSPEPSVCCFSNRATVCS